MTADADPPPPLSLKRWSRRKLEATRESAGVVAPVAPAPVAPAPVAPAPVESLPPVESLTIDSDFVPFFKPEVGEGLKRQALKQLFRDPHFNVMDGLDVYVDDYSIPDPISPDIVKQMVQGRYIFDPPATRINAQGHVEDVPPDDAALADTPRVDAAEPATEISGSTAPASTPDEEAVATPLPDPVPPEPSPR